MPPCHKNYPEKKRLPSGQLFPFQKELFAVQTVLWYDLPMDENEKTKKRKRNRIVFLLLAGALAAAAGPGIRFFERMIAAGSPTESTHMAAILLCGIAAIVFLTLFAGLLSLVKWPVSGTSFLIVLVAAACGAALYHGVQNVPAPAEETPGTPRPTITPPPVEIVTVERQNGNPETGTVFYRRYGNEQGTLRIENGSRSDICFRMVDRHGLLVLIFYIRAGDSCIMPVPTGTYEFRCVTGGEWVDEFSYFGENSHFRKLPSTYVFYASQPEQIVLTSGLPEMRNIKKKDFEETSMGYNG